MEQWACLPSLYQGKAKFPGTEADSRQFNQQTIKKALVNPDMGWTMHYYSNVITNYGS